MTNAQRETADALAAMLPGASWQADPYTTSDGDALYGDGSVLVHLTRPIRSEELGPSGRRLIVGWAPLGSARVGGGGFLLGTTGLHG